MLPHPAKVRRLALSALLACAMAVVVPACDAGPHDVLLEIVTRCLDPAAEDYCSLCRLPRNDSACTQASECRQSTEVWALSSEFVAIRDIKMCGCPAEFVHGLALPRRPVKGVEDPARPPGIWQFAWDAGRQRIGPESLALAVNPARRRSQDQLHVHILRLRNGVAAAIEDNTVGQVTSLDEVWRTAARAAEARGLDDYGVLVVRRAEGVFDVVVTATSPEAAFTLGRCH